jgi:hypothetical protein
MHGTRLRLFPGGRTVTTSYRFKEWFVKSIKAILGVTALACMAITVPSAHAQTLQVLTAGSSAQFGPFAVAAYALAKSGGATAYHYTAKTSSCVSSSTCYTSLEDNRPSGAPLEPGNLWVVWSTNGIWAYLSVDSTVGVRGFQSYPRASLALAPQSTLPLSATSNYLFWSDSTNDTALTTTVYNALNGAALTAANTDIRPEDALFATNRAINTLGYSASNPIQSYFSGTITNPIAFALSAGTADPISKETIPASHAFVTFPIGAAPIVFIANSSLSAATNLKVTQNNTNNASALFSGTGNCAGNLLDGVASNVILSPILREPLSGTMNTTEYTNFVLATTGSSQETGINTNPAHQPCGSTGFRDRAIGTGEMVNAVKEATSLKNVATNAVGYSFFSYESTAGATTYKYITLDGVDPINSTYSTGTLPTCGSGSGYLSCPVTGGASFPHLRDGSYRSWSLYRVISDSATLPNSTVLNQTTAEALVAEAEYLVNAQIPDFVPFSPQCRLSGGGTSDPGLDVYREHFTPTGVTLPTVPAPQTAGVPNDGALGPVVKCTVGAPQSFTPHTLGGQDPSNKNTELGGDVGGAIVHNTSAPTPPGPTTTSHQ